MRLTHRLAGTREEHGKAALCAEIDRLLARAQDAARALEPTAASPAGQARGAAPP